MNKVDEDALKKLIHTIGLKHNLQDSIINKIVNSPYRFARETITNIDIENIKDEDEFNKLKTNFLFAYIGKLYTSYSIYTKILKQKDKLKEYHNLKQSKNEIK